MKNILFVCTGNSCRSVMAEGLLKKVLADRPNEFKIGSAGISALDGFPPSPETVDVMWDEDVDVSHHRSRRLTKEMIRAADEIYVMERMHREIILRSSPESAPKVHLMTEFFPENNEYRAEIDIPDPIRMSDTYYRNVLAVIRDCVRRLAEKLRQ